MPSKKTAKKAAKKAAPKKKEEKKVEETTEAPAEAADTANTADKATEPKGAKDVDLSKDKSSIEATGKFEVIEVASGKFRMFNQVGQAVSPIVAKDDKTEAGKPALAKLIRDARRSNALRKQREIQTPKGHEELK